VAAERTLQRVEFGVLAHRNTRCFFNSELDVGPDRAGRRVTDQAAAAKRFAQEGPTLNAFSLYDAPVDGRDASNGAAQAIQDQRNQADARG
jgi:D-serine deaminase-like pyridoxal phosphate-dependent protein